MNPDSAWVSSVVSAAIEERPALAIRAGEMRGMVAGREAAMAAGVKALGDFGLASAVVAGDSLAWQVLYTEIREFAVRVAKRHARDETDAEEIAEDFLADARTRLVGYGGRCSLAGWMAAVIPNVVRDWYRRRSRDVSLEDGDTGSGERAAGSGGPGGEPCGEDAGTGVDRRRCESMLAASLGWAWERLDSKSKQLLEWRFLHGLRGREIAGLLLRIGEDVVSKRVKKALQKVGRDIQICARQRCRFSQDEFAHCLELVVGNARTDFAEVVFARSRSPLAEARMQGTAPEEAER